MRELHPPTRALCVATPKANPRRLSEGQHSRWV